MPKLAARRRGSSGPLHLGCAVHDLCCFQIFQVQAVLSVYSRIDGGVLPSGRTSGAACAGCASMSPCQNETVRVKEKQHGHPSYSKPCMYPSCDLRMCPCKRIISNI